jgi:predicted secreted protein
MSIVLGVAIFFVVWWIVLFAVLPFGVRTQAEAGETVPGTPASAPAKFRLARMFLINTAVSIVVFCIIWAAIEFDFFGISELANKVQS